jgi:hypothetical protein
VDKMYRSKIDWWIGLMLGIGIAVLAGLGVAILVNRPPVYSHPTLMAFVFFLAAGFVAWVLFSTRYTITAGCLLVRSAWSNQPLTSRKASSSRWLMYILRVSWAATLAKRQFVSASDSDLGSGSSCPEARSLRVRTATTGLSRRLWSCRTTIRRATTVT